VASAKVLVVDDSATELAVASSALRQGGFEVAVADDGERALAIALGNPPDVVVLDVVMPRKNGFQVCRQIKTTAGTKHAKVLMLSTKNQESDRFWALRQGADMYMTKPYAAQDLIDNVNALLGQ
jgi:twitching motility two-component system response regulator PilH